jgi:choline dehydrogenase-like flavoprotein
MAITSSPLAKKTGQWIAGWLKPEEFAILEAICETLLPSLDPPAGSSQATAAYYRRSAHDLHVAEHIAEKLGAQGEEVHTDIRRFLSLFVAPPAGLLFAGSPRPFMALSQEKRAAYLLALSNSPVQVFRQGYQGIKRLACLIYFSTVDETGVNPNWEVLDYAPPQPPTGEPQTIKPLTITEQTTLEVDAVIIGSGAGGAVVAAELAQAGKNVVVLEKGGYNYDGTFTQQEEQATSELFMKQGALATKDLGVVIMAGSTLGGSTVINWMTCFRTPGDVLEEWDQVSGLRGYFTSSELQDSFAQIEQRLNVHVEQIQHNRPNQVLFDGAKALGYHADANPRNAVGCQQRCRGCNFGCRHGSSQSTMKTYMQDAYDHGAQIIVNCSADRILRENGRAVGVQAHVYKTDRHKTYRLTVHAKAVIVAGGAIYTPAILLRSGLENPHIGRHLHLHPTTVSVGLYPEKIYAWQGVMQSAYSDQFTHLDGNYGYKLEAAPGQPGLFSMARPWYSARDHREQMLRCSYLSPMIVVARDKGEGTITLDRAGEPLIDYVVSPFDRKHIAHGIRHGARIHLAAGANEVISLQNKPTYMEPSAHKTMLKQQLRQFDRQVARHGMGINRILMFSAHQMGSCRMGSNPKASVANEHCEVHGTKGLFICDSSVFPNAVGVNPMLSIMALAHRASQYIKTEV